MTIGEAARDFVVSGHGRLGCRSAPKTIHITGRIDATIKAKEADFEILVAIEQYVPLRAVVRILYQAVRMAV